MSPLLRTLAALLVVAWCAGCAGGASVPARTAVGGGLHGADVALAANTCWTSEKAGADPQRVLQISTQYKVSYFDAAHALAAQPAFALTQACGAEHAIEVYKVVAMDQVKPKVTNYAALLRSGRPAYRKLAVNVERACMNQVLLDGARSSGFAGAVLEPAVPATVTLGWAAPSPEQWAHGQRVFACTMSQAKPGVLRYPSLFTRGFPTVSRTCIDSRSLIYVDCARKHDRERIALLDLRAAVAAGSIPGARAVRPGSDGRYVDLPPATFAALDRGCATYLRHVSTMTRLTGVAEIDPAQWPTPDGSYLVACEADTPPTKKSLVTQGSVYNR